MAKRLPKGALKGALKGEGCGVSRRSCTLPSLFKGAVMELSVILPT